MKSWVKEDHSSTVQHRGDRETSSAVQRVDFDGSAVMNFFVGSASHRVGDGSSRNWVVSAVCRVGGSYRRSASALRRQCIGSTVCVGSALRRVTSRRHTSERLTSAAQRFVGFSSTAASQQRVSS